MGYRICCLPPSPCSRLFPSSVKRSIGGLRLRHFSFSLFLYFLSCQLNDAVCRSGAKVGQGVLWPGVGAERTPWHRGVQESKAESYRNTVNIAPTRLSALPYRQPLLLRLLKVLVRGKFSVGHRGQNHWDAALSCPPPPLCMLCRVHSMCSVCICVHIFALSALSAHASASIRHSAVTWSGCLHS